MRMFIIGCLACMLASTSAFAGPVQGGYGGGQWGGVDGTGIEAKQGGPTQGSNMCNKCEPIEQEVSRSVTNESGHWSVEGGAVGPIPQGKMSYSSPKKTETKTYARSVPSHGLTADGDRCSCSRGSLR